MGNNRAMKRLALISDIHANVTALDAVLADIDSCGLTDIYCLGDLVGYGPWPADAIDRVRAAGIPTVRGNYDDGVGKRSGECGCYYATDQARQDGEASYAFTAGVLDDARAAWLAALPDELRVVESGVRVLLTHGSPRKINEYLLPDRSDEQLARLARDADADVVCVGHVHIPYHRAVATDDGGQAHYISSGSVGKPKDGDPRACWVELVIGEQAEVRAAAPGDSSAGPAGASGAWAAAVVHRVAYDVEEVAAAMLAVGLPATLALALRIG